MLRAAVLRGGQAAVVAVVVVTLAFGLVHLAPGDPFASALEFPGVTDAVRARWRDAYGLDAPPAEQYLRWWSALARGDLGWSHGAARPVRDVLADALPPTLLLGGTGLTLGLAGGVLLGIWQAARPDRRLARGSELLLLALLAVPDFVLATIALGTLTVRWPLFPVGGLSSLDGGDLADRLRHLMLPALVLALAVVPLVAQVQRAALREVLDAEFVRTARAKGAGELRVLLRHAWRASLPAVLALTGALLPVVVGGAVFVERVFAWPGMGLTILEAIGARDYHLVLAGVLVLSLGVTVGSALADVAALWADPRQRERP